MGFDKAKTISAAEKYIAQGKITQALQEYARVVERDPNDFASLNMLGDLYARLKRGEEAVAHFLRVAEHYREQGFTLKAVAMYKKILRQGVSVPGVARNLAALYEQQGLYVEAREQYMQLAEDAARAGQTRDSLEALRRIADFDPRNVDIRLRLAEGCAAEGMGREASDAYVEAGELLLARGDARQALDCYKSAHGINPASHAVLRGLVAACSALGEADEAAQVLERVAAERPDDLELRAMLARAYVDAEDATAAERATESLVAADATNFPLLFDVTRLYLRRSYVNEAVRVLSRAVEPALNGRQEAALLDILSEALARDPEHIEALKLLLRIYTWQRDDERMRVTLERLAEAAQTHNLAEEERRALEHLVRLVPFDQSYHERLEALGGASPPGARAETPGVPGGSPAYEIPSFDAAPSNGGQTLYDFDPFAAAAAPPPQPAAFEFEWNSVAAPAAGEAATAPSAHVDPSVSFADLNEDFAEPAATTAPAGRSAFDLSFEQTIIEDATPSTQDEGEGVATADSATESPAPAAAGGRTEAVLRQELESVDFYLEQGYADIARDTLDMLERQFGAGAEIAARRARLNGGGAAHPDSDASPAVAEPAQAEPVAPAAPHAEETITFDDFAAFDFEAAPPAEAPPEPATPASTPRTSAPLAAQSPSSNGNGRAPAIDPGLAAVFDEFRESVEGDDAEAQDDDYETCYNLGLAYREMGLLDEAVEQFQRAANVSARGAEPSRLLQCCNMLGHCFVQKGLPRPAAHWFERGLKLPELTDDERQALRYELASAYEQMGDIDRAIDTFSEIYGIDVSYRGVAERLRDLQSLKAVGS
ncbi:MAG TPA: tetratricopeptide repeat protein [Pyrinomonadaceae bacterium]|nr:tetratricopeptide repeat protein [Pyrinomonadaceae bacterium]